MGNFMGTQLEIRKLDAKNTLPKYPQKTRFDSKLPVFNKIPLLVLTNQNKALCIKTKLSFKNSRGSVF